MDTSHEAAEPFRSRVHALLRSSILEVAYRNASEMDWSAVRLSDIAAEVGVSRQTIYNEFGNKAQLGKALFAREMDLFMIGILKEAESGATMREALRGALNWIITESSGHPFLQRMVRTSIDGDAETLLPLITINAHRTIGPVREALVDYFEQRWPSGDREHTTLLVDLCVRFVMSLVIAPGDRDTKQAVEVIISMVVAEKRESRDTRTDA